MSKYAKWITAFCETDKCEYFLATQHFAKSQTGNIRATGKSYFCKFGCQRFDEKGNEIYSRANLITSQECPKKEVRN